jgi:membrane-associated phospholipid phosphatase
LKTALRVWPPIGFAAMLGLGWAVRSGPIGIDRWFQQLRHGPAQWLLVFTDPRVLALMWLAVLAVAAYRRRWRLMAAIVVSPAVALVLEQLLKRLFGREKGAASGSLAYPSGHTTVMVVVVGMVLLVVGAGLWVLAGAVVYCLLGMIGQGATYHYFTDTVGALLLGTAIVCVAARAVELDRCQPRCDPRHIDG